MKFRNSLRYTCFSMDTSWDSSDRWYDQLVGEKGHYYHQAIVFPKGLPLLGIGRSTPGSLLDLGCGNGVLARHLPPSIEYVGIDLSENLLNDARKQTPKGRFLAADATQPLPLKGELFDFASFILSLQNMENGKGAIQQASLHLKPKGKLLLVLNHPCFRIPRQSQWGIDEAAKLQYRRIQAYATPLKIPIQTHPGKQGASSSTFSFHHPLSDYAAWLREERLSILSIEEWFSDKQSEGKFARMENRARREFPLFLALLAQKE
jgi:ubiquinone/menaquinone biosynthesis C-methylase UbiE